jgi:hypothetical protein
VIAGEQKRWRHADLRDGAVMETYNSPRAAAADV